MSDSENLNSVEIFNRGKRLYICGDYSKALECLSKACKLISLEKNDTCDDLFEPYLYYSKSLYMYNKCSSDLIGDGVKEVMGEEEINDPSQLDVISENNDLDETVNDEDDDTKEQTNTPVEESQKDLCTKVQSTELDQQDNKSDDDGDVGYLEMAYQTVECAKLIIARQLAEGILDKKELELKLADCCDVAADIYVEEEVLKEAIAQYEQALQLRCKNMDPHDRSIAESYYKIAMAYNVDYQCGEAKKYFVHCRDILACNRDFCIKRNESTEELDSILVELDEKIIEAEDGEKEFERSKESLKELLGVPARLSSATSIVPTTSTTEITDISHLIRKKAKKPHDGDIEGNETPAKVSKTDE